MWNTAACICPLIFVCALYSQPASRYICCWPIDIDVGKWISFAWYICRWKLGVIYIAIFEKRNFTTMNDAVIRLTDLTAGTSFPWHLQFQFHYRATDLIYYILTSVKRFFYDYSSYWSWMSIDRSSHILMFIYIQLQFKGCLHVPS